MEIFKKLAEVASHRRFWAGLFGAISFLTITAGYSSGIDVNALTDATMRLVESATILVSAALSLWSLIKPKSTKVIYESKDDSIS